MRLYDVGRRRDDEDEAEEDDDDEDLDASDDDGSNSGSDDNNADGTFPSLYSCSFSWSLVFAAWILILNDFSEGKIGQNYKYIVRLINFATVGEVDASLVCIRAAYLN